jgi:hypothetical protein
MNDTLALVGALSASQLIALNQSIWWSFRLNPNIFIWLWMLRYVQLNKALRCSSATFRVNEQVNVVVDVTLILDNTFLLIWHKGYTDSRKSWQIHFISLPHAQPSQAFPSSFAWDNYLYSTLESRTSNCIAYQELTIFASHLRLQRWVEFVDGFIEKKFTLWYCLSEHICEYW